MQDFSGGGGGNLKILGRPIHAAKLRAVARGYVGLPPRKFFEMVQFRAF